MKRTLQKITASLFFVGLTFGSTTLYAQNRIEGAVQQGNGAYVQKSDRPHCIGSSLLGVPGLGDCLNMTQEKFMVTPSGNVMSVWTGMVPTEAHPAKQIVYNSTYTETLSNGKTVTYATVSTTNPDGSIKLTLTSKANRKANGKAKGRG